MTSETIDQKTGTRERILECAAALFSDQSYSQGSIRNIAAASGIRGPSVYHHFKSKEEMTVALLQQGARMAMAELDKVDIDGFADDPAGLLDAATDAHMRAYRHPGRALMALVRIYRQLPPDLFVVARNELHPYLERWTAIIATLRGDPDRRADSEAIGLVLFGALNAIVDWQERPGFAMDTAELRALFVDVMLRGFVREDARPLTLQTRARA